MHFKLTVGWPTLMRSFSGELYAEKLSIHAALGAMLRKLVFQLLDCCTYWGFVYISDVKIRLMLSG
jgi:hypothetical protein